MDQILQGMANVVFYRDDILIASSTEEEHLATLESDEVLSRLEKSMEWWRISRNVSMEWR